MSKNNAISILRFDVVPEQEEAFLQWYDQVHTPEILGRSFKRVRRYVAVERKMPAYLDSVTSLVDQPRHLVLLEKDSTSSERVREGPRDESGTRDFARWLPHLARASLIGYRCVMVEERPERDGENGD
jgi:hypothetical protein